MEMKAIVYKIDRIWFDVKMNQIIGDMGFTFGDSDETRSLSYEDTKKGILYGIKCDIEDEYYQFNDSEQIPIYQIEKAELTFELDDEETIEQCLCFGKLNGNFWEIVENIIPCTEMYANEIGLIKELKTWSNKKVTFVEK